jgi:hypothetical protein
VTLARATAVRAGGVTRSPNRAPGPRCLRTRCLRTRCLRTCGLGMRRSAGSRDTGGSCRDGSASPPACEPAGVHHRHSGDGGRPSAHVPKRGMTTLRAATGSSRRPSTRRDLPPLPDIDRCGPLMLRAGDPRRCMRVLLVSSLVTLTAVLGGWLVFTFISGPLVTSMYRGESLPGLNRLIRDHTHTPLESYLASSRVQFSRLVMLAVCMQAIVVAGLLWEETVLLQAVGGAAHGGRHGARRGRWERLGVAAVPRCAHAAAAPRSRRGYFSTRCGEKAPTATAGSGASVESGTSEPWFAFPPSYVRIGDVAQGSTESVICRYLARRLPRHPILAKRATCFAFAATIKTGTCAAFAAVFRSMCSALSVGRESGSVTELLFFPRPGP